MIKVDLLLLSFFDCSNFPNESVYAFIYKISLKLLDYILLGKRVAILRANGGHRTAWRSLFSLQHAGPGGGAQVISPGRERL